MLCATLKESSPLALLDANNAADLIEFRLDLFPNLDDVAYLRAGAQPPVIFTCQQISDELIALQPDYIDLPHTAEREAFEAIPPSIKRICSFHDFAATPDNLEEIYAQMQTLPADLFKIATYAHTTLDALRLLAFVKQHGVIGVAMGEAGRLTRILGPALGSPWTYAPLAAHHATAEGQLLLQELKGIYHTHRLSPTTALYGLIGSPLSHSISHRTHNQMFEQCGLDAVYVKMELGKEELPEFFPLARQIGFRGLSVTMPLKEAVLPFLDGVETDIEAINTLTLEEHLGKRLLGTNTDGVGALEAIEKQRTVAGARVAILGAGGAAKAIAHEARRRGATVELFNRQTLSDFPKARYEILVNTIPTPIPIEPRAGTVVMDIVVSETLTPLLVAAQKRGCVIIEGVEMFMHQAIGQFTRWFHEASC